MGCRCGGGTEHEHAADPDAASAKSLHQFVDMSQSHVMNAQPMGLLERVLRSRFLAGDEGRDCLESDTDPQLLIKIQFTGTVKIKSIAIHSDGTAASPRLAKAYVNAPDLDFASVDGKTPAQTWDLVEPSALPADRPLLYLTKIFKFSNVNHLTLFVPSNFGAPKTRISFVGVYGDFLHNRVGVVDATYELKPNVSDHKTGAQWMSSFQPGY